MKRIPVMKECVTALGIVLNVAGAFIALNLHLPIYLDSVGTLMNAALFGPAYGILTGLLGSLISGFTFDIYSLYFAPMQIFTGCMAGLYFKSQWGAPAKANKISGALFISIPTSIASAVIAAFVFGGITSAGSSFIVQLLTKCGMGLTASCFVVQIITDFADEFAGIIIVSAALKAMTSDMKMKLMQKN